MTAIAWSVWITISLVVVLIFWWLWRFTSKIEKEEEEEKQWKEFVNNMWETDPQSAYYYQQLFDQKYK